MLYERTRAAVAENPIPTRTGDVSITVSFGVSMWREGETEDDLLATGDAALYRAKSAGRNRVCLAGETQPIELAIDGPAPVG